MFSGFFKRNFSDGGTSNVNFVCQFQLGPLCSCKIISIKDAHVMVYGPFPVSGTVTIKISRSVLLKVKVTKGQIANVAFRLL